MKDSCIKGYEWPAAFSKCISDLDSIETRLDCEMFFKLLYCYDKSEQVVISLLSKEYLNVGKVWLRMLKGAEIKHYIIIALDEETADLLNSHNVPNCRLKLKGFEIA